MASMTTKREMNTPHRISDKCRTVNTAQTTRPPSHSKRSSRKVALVSNLFFASMCPPPFTLVYGGSDGNPHRKTNTELVTLTINPRGRNQVLVPASSVDDALHGS